MPAILEAISNAFKAVVAMLGMAKDKQLRNEGATAQTAANLAAENAELKHALDVANNPPAVNDSLRDGRF